MFSSRSADSAKTSTVLDSRTRPGRRRPRRWRTRCAPMSRPASKPSGRGVACSKATSRLTRKASATRSTGTPASCLREARAERKGLISSPELPHAFIGSTGLADGVCWWPGWVPEPIFFEGLADSKTVLLNGEDHDVFGDDTVVIKSTPGHTPGHQALFLQRAQTENR